MDGQGSNDSLVPGDWFSYKLAIDLPGIPSNKPKMLKIELLTNDPVSGKTYHCKFYFIWNNSGDPTVPPPTGEDPEPGETCLNIIHPNVTDIGHNFITNDIVDEPTVMDVGGLKLEKMVYKFESIATGNAEGSGNRLVIDYDVAFNNIHENVDASSEYFVTSGVAIYNAAGDQVME